MFPSQSGELRPLFLAPSVLAPGWNIEVPRQARARDGGGVNLMARERPTAPLASARSGPLPALDIVTSRLVRGFHTIGNAVRLSR